jgi:hypothetical protein
MRLARALPFAALLLLLRCCSTLLDFDGEAAAILRSARPRPLILSPLSGSTVAHDGIIRVRIVVPALARAACARASALSLLVDDVPLASQPLPPRSPHPFHLAFDIDVASLRLQHGACELLVQLADDEGAALGEASAVEIVILPPADASSASPSSSSLDDSASTMTPHAEHSEHFACSSRPAASWMCRDDRGCSSAGKCVRGVCQCQPGWYGATCSVMPEHSSEYLPATDPLRDAAAQCSETLRHALVAVRLREVVGGWRERAADCACFDGGKDDGSDSSSCPVVGSVPLYGIGAQIRHATRLLHTALSEGRPLVLVPERGVDARMVSFAPCMPLPGWISRSAPSHTHADPGHAFNGWKSDMTTADNATAYGFPLQIVCVLFATHSCSPQLRLRATSQVGRLWPNSHIWRYLAPEFSPPPPEFAAAGTLAFRSELTASLLTPLPWFDAVLVSHAAMLGLTSPSLGVHLRRGDACVHSEWDPPFRPSCAPLAVYVDAALVMIRRYNPASVFVSSDDSSAAAEFEAALCAAGVDIPVVTANVGEMYRGGSLLEERVGWDGADAADIAWTTLRDVFMLARSEYFVVNFASQLSRVAFELAVSRRSGLLPPYISVDGFPWCDAPCEFGRRRQRAVSEAISTNYDALPQC